MEVAVEGFLVVGVIMAQVMAEAALVVLGVVEEAAAMDVAKKKPFLLIRLSYNVSLMSDPL